MAQVIEQAAVFAVRQAGPGGQGGGDQLPPRRGAGRLEAGSADDLPDLGVLVEHAPGPGGAVRPGPVDRRAADLVQGGPPVVSGEKTTVC